MSKATVKIELPDTGEVELVPSLAAMEYLAKHVDNFQAVYARLGTMSLETYAAVIKAGLLTHPQLKNAKLSDVKEEVFNAGLISLMEPLIRFITILLNGGKEPKVEEEAKAADPEM